jgi:hypothetical protein
MFHLVRSTHNKRGREQLPRGAMVEEREGMQSHGGDPAEVAE